MINLAMIHLRDDLNTHLSNQLGVSEDLVVLGPLTDAQGQPTAQTRNRLAMFVTNIQTGSGTAVPSGVRMTDRTATSPQSWAITANFMIASGYDTYEEGLKLLSSAVKFFAFEKNYTPQSAPSVPIPIQNLRIEPVDIDTADIGPVWAVFGGRYVPSAMYKLTALGPYDSIQTTDPTITGIDRESSS
ncbi:DUF4255 domain-containing protein [Octadecabacter sp. G9-8]|uniref:DUF4255 domain-containing protein n=1 Tax=Octadecabacter dasysiphoniae TaxID=2909341 RepID=A0ABS9D1R0_9RHOB|nr:Pvc16 family protein [Octadecabacter dasysiphoniae]MCF2872564.1 DUF4255 domain-containing protein [Octadecabacter dasysiphoniae]